MPPVARVQKLLAYQRKQRLRSRSLGRLLSLPGIMSSPGG
jgi:hypothetical protein